MADELGIKINELGAAQTILGTEFVPIDNGVDTLKATLDQVKEHAIGDNNISALGDGSVTGAILNVKSTSETADSNIAETMAQNGAHNIIVNNAVTHVDNEVTFTVHDDKSITVTVASTTAADRYVELYHGTSNDRYKAGEKFKLSGGANSTITVLCLLDSTTVAISRGNVVEFTMPTVNNHIQFFVYLDAGTEAQTVTVYPMLTLASDPSNEYTAPAMTNRELTEKMTSRYQMAKQMYDGQSFIAVGQVSGSDDGWAYITLPFNVQPVSVTVSDMYMPGIKTYANTDLIEFSTTNGIAKYRIADLVNYKDAMFVSTITCNY